jgi:aryl-alcohol dehydrogenase-like predicted oxidoreductase
MEKVQLGKSDLFISRIGLGCMSLKPGAADNEKILQAAFDKGINFFDTADLYDKGANEELVGKALKPKRQEVIIATKVGNQWKEDGSGWDWNPNKEYILLAVEKSLQRLQTDYIDLYQLHGGTINDPIDETIEAFEMLKQHNIGVLARGSVAQGLLINKPSKPYLNYSAEEVERMNRAVYSFSNQRSTAQTALQFALYHPSITSTIAGIRTLEQLNEAVDAVVAPMLNSDEVQALQKVIPINKYSEHR